MCLYILIVSFGCLAVSQRNPTYWIHPIHTSSEPCQDDSTFRDVTGLGCDSWAGFNCTRIYGIDYGSEDMKLIREGCPAACSLCVPQSRVEFREELLKEVKDWTWCSDNPNFVDAKGYTCSDWTGYKVSDLSDYSEEDIMALTGHCGITFGTKSCSVCEDNPMWKSHCYRWTGYQCISDNRYFLGNDEVWNMLATAGNCPATCGLCDKIDEPTEEELLLSCTDDPYYQQSHLAFCFSNDNGWCKAELDCDGDYLHSLINERMPSSCFRCVPPEERLNCQPGTYRDISDLHNLHCSACVPGKFNPFHNASECVLAAKGHFVEVDLGITALPCEAGFYSLALGSDACMPCPSGSSTYGLKGQTACPVCPLGSFSSKNGSARCDLCERGRFAKFTGSSECVPCEGSHRVTKELGAFSNTMCICGEGYFEVAEDPNCRECLEGMTCPLGSSMVNYWAALHGNGSEKTAYPLLLEKYFAFPSSPLDVFECMAKESCPGGALAGSSPCCSGCHGLNCGLCEDNLFHSNGVCIPCADAGWQLPFVLAFAPFGIGIFHHFVSYKAGQREVLKSNVLSGVIIGMGVFLAQVMGMYSQLLINWPLKVMDVYQASSSLVMFNFEVLRPRCTISNSLVTRFFLQLAIPMFVGLSVFLCIPTSRILELVTNHGFPTYSKASAFNTIGTIFQGLYISLVALSISVFACYESPNGKTTLRMYSFIECGSPDHSVVVPFGVFAIVVYVVGFFSLCIACNYAAPRHFSRPAFRQAIRFLIFKFRPSKWWYGIVLMLRSALIGMVTVMEPNDGSIQFYLMVIFLLFGVVAHLEVTPYKNRCANRLESLLLVLLIIVLTLGSWFIPRTDSEGRDEGLTVLILVGLGVIVFLMFCVFLYAIRLALFKEKIHQQERYKLTQVAQVIQAAFSTLLAMSDEEFEKLLLMGDYLDHLHLVQASRFILADACGIQGKRMSGQRLVTQKHMTDSCIPEQRRQATEKLWANVASVASAAHPKTQAIVLDQRSSSSFELLDNIVSEGDGTFKLARQVTSDDSTQSTQISVDELSSLVKACKKKVMALEEAVLATHALPNDETQNRPSPSNAMPTPIGKFTASGQETIASNVFFL